MAANNTVSSLLERIAELEAQLSALARAASSPPLSPPPASSPPSPPLQIDADDSQTVEWWVIAVPIIGAALVVALGVVVCRCMLHGRSGRGCCHQIGCCRLWLRKVPTRRLLLRDTADSTAADQEQDQAANTSRNSKLLEMIGSTSTTRDATRAEVEDGLPLCSEEELEAVIRAAGSPDAALLAAVHSGSQAQQIAALLQRGASPNVSFLDRSILASAVRSAPPATTQLLLRAGAIIDRKDACGWTPLMHAIDAHSTACPRERVLALLLDSGAAVDVWGDDLKGPRDLLQAKPGALETIMQEKTQQMAATG
mmetsp:Transcript_36462/g.85193  ORF Transcript_36462/g.85193 Transcript_36462/m.85193 type:complete len:311 (-) Transcript_36462:394-1326(-)